MYKDVKKKILAVVLCICMVIGAVEIVPRVQAANNVSTTQRIKGTDSDGDSVTYIVTLEKAELPYTGKPQMPKLISVKKENGDGEELSDFFTLSGSAADVSETSYKCELVASGNTWNVDKQDDNVILFKIVAATIQSMSVTLVNGKDTVVYDSDKNNAPSMTVTVRTTTGTEEIPLNSQQYKTDITYPTGETGQAKVAVSITDTVNFKSYSTPEEASYWIAYLLAEKLKIKNASSPYTGANQLPEFQIVTGSGEKDLSDTDTLNIVYSRDDEIVTQIITPGIYTVSAMPKNTVANLDGSYYAGSFEGTYTISALGKDGLSVRAPDPQNNNLPTVIWENGQKKTLVYSYNGGNAVTMEGVAIYDTSRGNATVTTEFEPIYSNERDKGQATVRFTPKRTSSYYKEDLSNDITITYFIVDELKITQLEFENYSPGVTNIPYTGSIIIPKTGGITVMHGDNPVGSSNYDVFYQYKSGGVWSENVNANDPNLATSGEKKVVIIGKKNYAGKSAVAYYTVSAVDISTEDAQANMELELDMEKDGNNNYYCYYTGSEIRPTVKLRYYNTELKLNEDYSVSYINNTDAGTATVTVTGKAPNFKGSMSITFLINRLNLNTAAVSGAAISTSDNPAYYYTGTSINPVIQLNEGTKYQYTMKEAIDYTASYSTPGSVPSALGTYQITITNKNTKNIIGNSVTLTYEIVKRNISQDLDGIFTLDNVHVSTDIDGNTVREIEWNGGKTEPSVTCGSMTKDRDFTLRYENSEKPGTAKVIIEGKGNYTGTKEIAYTITNRKLNNINIEESVEVTKKSGNDGTTTYDVSIKLQDMGEYAGKYVLQSSTDYTITSVKYKTDTSDSTDYTNQITALPKAGEYTVILTATSPGNYTGTRTVTIGCGTDISNATWTISEGTLTYDGTPKLPSTIQLNIPYTDDNGNEKTSSIKYSKTDSKFTLEFERKDNVTDDEAIIHAGDVYMTAVGNPKYGYYGETKNAVKYYITPASLSKNYRAEIVDNAKEGSEETDNNGNKIYTFPYTSEAWNPAIRLVDENGDELDEIYYTVAYSDSWIERDTYTIKATATENSNYSGTVSVDFKIVAMDIANPKITVTAKDSSEYADGVPELIVRMTSYNYTLQKKQDYTYAPPEVTVDTQGNYVYEYVIEGKGNFTGSRSYQCKVSKTSLEVADSEDNWEVGEIYIKLSSCDMSQLYVDPDNPVQVTPTTYTVSYKTAEGKYKSLEEGTDFEVVGYGTNIKPGTVENNYIKITGKNGYTGTVKLPITLFTDIKTANFYSTSAIQPGASISLTDLETAIESGTLADLVWLYDRWSTNSSRMSTENYTVSVTDGYIPHIGSITFYIEGTKVADSYYAGTLPVIMTVTGSLANSDIKIYVDDDNAVEWPGTTVSPGATKVQVYDGNNLLTGGYADAGVDTTDWDYEYTFTDNSAIGNATVIVRGLNKYSDELTETFKITYPLSKLSVEITDENGVWKTYDGGSPEYLYQIDTTQNMPDIRLGYPDDGETVYLYPGKYYKTSYSGYTSAGTDKRIEIYPSQEEGYAGVLIGTSRTVSYTLAQIPAKKVTINVSNPTVTYSGFEKTAEDIGLSLTYGAYSLVENTDYQLKFSDATNADVVDGKPASVVITLMGNFTGTHIEEFQIQTLPIYSESDIGVVVKKMFYTGTVVAPEYTVSQLTGKLCTLKEGTDYKFVYYTDKTMTKSQQTPFTDVGDYYIVIEGMGNYQSSQYRYIPYRILTREMEDGLTVTFVNTDSCPVVSGAPTCIYNGSAHEPEVQVAYNGTILTKDINYEVDYANNTNAGTEAIVTVTGKGSFSGEKKLKFTIAPKDIAGDDMSFRNEDGTIFEDEAEYEWTKNPVQPKVSVYDNSRSEDLVQGEGAGDYTVTYTDNNEDQNTQVNAGKVTMTITGTGNYGGTKEFTYYIGEDISKAYALVNGKNSVSVTYNGLEQAPKTGEITVVAGGTVLEDANGEKRYDIAYYKNGFSDDDVVTRDQMVDAGTYYVAIVGVPTKGTYAKSSVSNSCVYTINPRSIAPSYILVSGFDSSYYYTGQAIEPKGIVVEDNDLPVTSDVNDPQRRTLTLINGVDYDISYRNHVSAGEAVIVVNGKGNYTGSREAYFTIISSDATGNNTWNGNSEGTGSISIGTTTISVSDIKLGFDNSTYNCMRYTGYPVQPQVTINGMSANDFIITAQNNINPGMATLYIQGAGNNYTGQIIMYYAIKADLGTYGRVVDIADQVYTGYQITPNVTITCGGNLLNQGSDFTVTYANNINVGRATVVAYAASDSYYTGSITSGFNISNGADGMQVTGYASSYTYSGYPITPDVVVTMNGRVLNRGTDYTVSYSNNINVGTATMIVTGLGSFSGRQTINFTIEAKNIENCQTTAVTNYQYTGNTYTPNVTITDSSTGKTLVAGTDYTITYSNNTNPGTASITVTALSKNYTGTKVIPFKITSAAVSGLRTSTIKNNSIKLAWSAQDYADGYQICNSKNQVVATTRKNSYTVKGLTSCTTYKFKVRSYVENADGTVSYGNFSTAVSAKTLLNTPTLKVKSTSKGKVTLTWTKVAKATGYEIYYSTKKNGVYTRLKTISKSSKRRYVDAGLASGEKYYYTIRAYRTANGVKTYSNYNTIKSVKVK